MEPIGHALAERSAAFIERAFEASHIDRDAVVGQARVEDRRQYVFVPGDNPGSEFWGSSAPDPRLASVVTRDRGWPACPGKRLRSRAQDRRRGRPCGQAPGSLRARQLVRLAAGEVEDVDRATLLGGQVHQTARGRSIPSGHVVMHGY